MHLRQGLTLSISIFLFRSFTGYQLGLDESTCEDIDECAIWAKSGNFSYNFINLVKAANYAWENALIHPALFFAHALLDTVILLLFI